MTTEKRTKEIKIRLTDSEHKSLLEMAQDQQLATFIREYCLSADSEHFAKIAKKNREKINRLSVSPELLRQLAGIGNNVNQVARVLNQQKKSGKEIELIKISLALQAIQKDLNAIKTLYSEGYYDS